MRLRWVHLLVILLLFGGYLDPGELHAQDLWRLSLEVTRGPADGSTRGEYRDNARGTAWDVLIAYRVRDLSAAGLVVAAVRHMYESGDTDLVCVPASDGGCVPAFPAFRAYGALAGLESSGTVTVRVLAGPSHLQSIRPGDPSAIGLHGRGEVAVPLVARIGGVISARGFLVPSYRGDSFRLGSVGIGIRIR